MTMMERTLDENVDDDRDKEITRPPEKMKQSHTTCTGYPVTIQALNEAQLQGTRTNDS